MIMNKIIPTLVLSGALVAAPAAAIAKAPLEGQWKNPKGSVVVRVGPCGPS